MRSTKQTGGAAAEKSHFTFRPSGPIRSIIALEMRTGKNRSAVIENLISAGAVNKYPKHVARFKVLQEEAA